MKRLAVFIAAALAACFLFAACKSGNDKAAQIALEEALKTETDLEFFILDDVADADFSAFQEIYGVFGASQYAPKRYGISESGIISEQQIPEQCVLYTVSAWPDHADGGAFVTDITVTDPKVRLFGLTVDSTAEEFIKKCELLGYKKVEKRSEADQAARDIKEYACVRSKDGKYSIVLAKTSERSAIRINAPVGNRNNIIF